MSPRASAHRADIQGLGAVAVDLYVRRARRILPAAVLTLVATDAAALLSLNLRCGVHALVAGGLKICDS